MQYHERKVNIYSRPRICFHGLKSTQYNMYQARKKDMKDGKNFYQLIIIMMIASITVIYAINAINPIIDRISINEVQNKVTRLTNQEAQEVIKDYEYGDLVNVILDDNNNISMIQANTNAVNKVASMITMRITDLLKENTNSNINIYLGTLAGISLFSGTGPKITAKISNTSSVNTKLKSEFSSAGINQTLHRIYLEMHMSVSILTPYHSISTSTNSEILLAESIIVGNVPGSYYYLNSDESIEPSDLIQ